MKNWVNRSIFQTWFCQIVLVGKTSLKIRNKTLTCFKWWFLFNCNNTNNASGPQNQNYSSSPLDQHFVQWKIRRILLFMQTNDLKNSNFKLIRSSSFVYFWNFKQTVTLVTCTSVYLKKTTWVSHLNIKMRIKRNSFRFLLHFWVTECKRIRHFILVVKSFAQNLKKKLPYINI